MADFRPFSPCWGDISFTEPPRTTARCYAGAIILSCSPFGATARARGVAWPRCPWAAVGPDRTTRRHTKPHASTPGTTGLEGTGRTGGPGCGAHGRWRGMDGQRGNAPNHTPAHQAPLAWRAPEGPEGLAAVPVGGGGAWPGFETTRRAKLAARTARGRAAAHGHTKQPGPPTHHTAPGTPVGPQASRPTGTHSGRTQRRPAARGHTKPPDPTGAGRLRQSARGTQRRITTMSGSPRPLS